MVAVRSCVPGAGSRWVAAWRYVADNDNPAVCCRAVLLLLRTYLYCARVVVTQNDGVGCSSWLRCVLRCVWRSGSEETGARVGPLDALGMRQCEREVERRFKHIHRGKRWLAAAIANPYDTQR